MSPYRRQGGKSYYVNVRWTGWPQIRVATGTANKSRAIAMERTLHALKSAGRRDLLELIAAGRLRLDDVHDTYLRDPAALEQRVAKAQSQPLGALLDAWFAWLKDPATLGPRTRRRYSPNTVRRYQVCWQVLLKLMPRGYESVFTDLTTGFVADFRARRLREGAGGSTVNRDLTAMAAFLTWCERERGLVIQRPRLPREREHSGRERWLSATEIGALESALSRQWWTLFATLIYTGLRIGEAQGLLGADLRLAERRITVGQHQRVKTDLSVRDVPIPPPLAEIHAEHRLRFPYGPADPVFPFPYGSYQRAHRVFRAASLQAGLYQVHIHDLRHTFGVHCAKAGIPLARIQKLMGHATPVMTLRYLKHAPESYFSEDAARLAGSLTGTQDREVEAGAALLRQGFRPA